MPVRARTPMLGFALVASTALALTVATASPASASTPDTTAPTVTALTLAPATVDATYGDRDVVADLRIADRNNGGTAGAGLYVGSLSFSNGTTTLGPADIDDSTLVSGSGSDGTHDVHVPVPRGTPAGTYTATVTLKDRLGNTATVTASSAPLTVVAPSSDTVAPALSGAAAASPVAVDITRGDRDVAYGLRLTDAGAGVRDAVLTLRSPKGLTSPMPLTRVAGTEQDGRWAASHRYGYGDPAGAWTLVGLVAHDGAGNTLTQTSGLGGTETVNRTADRTGPTLVSVTPAQPNADTTSGPASVALTVHATDDVSGVSSGTLTFSAPDGTDTATATLDDVTDSGTPLDGVWRTTVTLPARADIGDWTLTAACLTDVQRNQTCYNDRLPPPPATITVSTGADTTAPTLTSLAVGPATVPSPDHTARLVVRLGVVDDSSGFASASVSFRAPDGTVNSRDTTIVRDPAQYGLTGTSTRGTVSFPAVLPVATVGTWTVAGVTLVDLAGNRVTYAGAQLPAASADVATQVTDRSAPTPTSLALAGATGADGSTTVTATLGVTDNVEAAAGFSSGFLTLRPSSGTDSLFLFFDGNQPVTGDYETGTYTDVDVLGPAATPGTWNPTGLTLYDRMGNSRTYVGTDQISAALGRPAPMLTVASPADTTAPALGSVTVDSPAADLTAGDAVTVHVGGTDDLSGLGSAAVTLTGPGGATATGTGVVDPSLSRTRVDVAVPVPAYGSSGTWTVTAVSLTDRRGNARTFAGTDLPAAPSVAVTAPADGAAPSVGTLTLAPRAVDTRTADAGVDALVRLVDNPAGVNTASVVLSSPDGTQTATATLQLLTGTIYDGWWQATVPVPQSSATGTWTATVLAADLGRNRATTGQPTTLAVTGVDPAPITTPPTTPTTTPPTTPATTPPTTPATTPPSSSPSTDPAPVTTPPTTPPATDPAPTTTPPPSTDSAPTTTAPPSTDPAPTTTPPTTPAAPVEVAVTVGTVSTSTTYGTPIDVTAKLTRSDTGAALTGRRAYLQWRPRDTSGAWHTLTTVATSSSSGWVAFTNWAPGYGVQVRVYTPAVTGFTDAASGYRTVAVRRAISVYSVTSVRHYTRFTIHGTVTPYSYGHRIYLQVWTGSYWSTITSPVMYRNTYSFTTYRSRAATVTYRIATPAYAYWSTTYVYRQVRVS